MYFANHTVYIYIQGLQRKVLVSVTHKAQGSHNEGAH